MVMPVILLQKTSEKSKAKEHGEAFKRQMALLEDGRLDKLFSEGISIEKCLKNTQRTSTI